MIRRETLQSPSPSDGAHGLIVAPAWVVMLVGGAITVAGLAYFVGRARHSGRARPTRSKAGGSSR